MGLCGNRVSYFDLSNPVIGVAPHYRVVERHISDIRIGSVFLENNHELKMY